MPRLQTSHQSATFCERIELSILSINTGRRRDENAPMQKIAFFVRIRYPVEAPVSSQSEKPRRSG